MTKDVPPAAGFKVQPNAAAPLLANFLRQLGILIGGGATMIALLRNFLGSGDVNEMIAWLTSPAGGLFFAAATFVLASLSSFWRTVRNEWIKRTLTHQVQDDISRIQAHGLGKLWIAIVSVLAAMGLSACATMGTGTPAQRLFEARADYVVIKGIAVDYAEGPSANPNVVLALQRIRDRMDPMADYADAYGACRGQPIGTVELPGMPAPIDCTTFNFSTQSVSSAAIALRSAILDMRSQLGRN